MRVRLRGQDRDAAVAGQLAAELRRRVDFADTFHRRQGLPCRSHYYFARRAGESADEAVARTAAAAPGTWRKLISWLLER